MSDHGPAPHLPPEQPGTGRQTALAVAAALILMLPAFCTLLVTGGQLDQQDFLSPLGILIIVLFLGGITLIGLVPRRPPH